MRSVSLLLLSNSKIVRVEAVIAMEIRFYKNVNGNALREPESKYLEDGIFELRSTFGGDTGRVLFFSMKAARFLLTGLKRKVEKLRAVK